MPSAYSLLKETVTTLMVLYKNTEAMACLPDSNTDSFNIFTEVLQGDAFTLCIFITHLFGKFPWCNGYHCRKWTWRHKFKSWTRLIAFHIALIPLGKV